MYSKIDEEFLYRLGKSLGFKIHVTVNNLFVVTNKSSWYIAIDRTPYKLYHSNYFKQDYSLQKFRHCYHKQNKYFRSVESALYYIQRHDRIRFTNDDLTERHVEEIYSRMQKCA